MNLTIIITYKLASYQKIEENALNQRPVTSYQLQVDYPQALETWRSTIDLQRSQVAVKLVAARQLG